MAHAPLASAFPPRAWLPYPPLLLRVARTAALVWAAFHVALLPLDVLVPNLLSAVLIVVVCAAAVAADLRRDSGHLFHANLGISPLRGPAFAAAAAGALEILFQLGARVLAGAP